MFDAVGRCVDVVGRQAEVLHEIRFPQAVAADQPGGAPAAVVGHVQLAVADFDAAAVAEHGERPASEPAAADGRDRFGRPHAFGGVDFFHAVEHQQQVFAEDAQRRLQIADERAEDAVLRREQDGEAVHSAGDDGHRAGGRDARSANLPGRASQ